MIPSFLPGLALALAIGLLIGFERGWQMRDEPDGQRVAGVRTFAMLGLFGGLVGLAIAGPLGVLALLTAAGAIGALLVGYAFDMRRDGTVSATAAIAAILTILLGALAASGFPALAAAATGGLVAILAGRKPLHALLRESSEDDLKALVRLALIVFLILPLLPDTGLGPFGSLNPHRLWFVVVVVGAISFGGYVLTRWLGRQRGGLVAATMGAVVSSTAVTLAAAREIRSRGGVANQAGIAVASSIMLGRTLLLVALLAPLALRDVAGLVGPAFVISVLAAVALVAISARAPSAAAEVPAKPPGFAIAFLFAVLVAAMTLAATWLEHRLGPESGAAAVALGGMVDVDSAIAAIGSLPPTALSPQLAALAIAVPVLFNTLLKLGMTVGIAGLRGARWAAAALAAPATIIAASVAALIL